MNNQQYYRGRASACFNKVEDIFAGNLKNSRLAFWQMGRAFNTCNDYIAN